MSDVSKVTTLAGKAGSTKNVYENGQYVGLKVKAGIAGVFVCGGLET